MDEGLTPEFIKRRFKTEDELDYACNVVFAKYLSLQDKIEYISSIDTISLDQIKIIFNLTYQKAQEIIDLLANKKVIAKLEKDKYRVSDAQGLKSILQEVFK